MLSLLQQLRARFNPSLVQLCNEINTTSAFLKPEEILLRSEQISPSTACKQSEILLGGTIRACLGQDFKQAHVQIIEIRFAFSM